MPSAGSWSSRSGSERIPAVSRGPRPGVLALLLAGAAAGLGLLPAHAAAQTGPAVGADFGLYSRHVWRGLTRRNAAVVQSDVFIAWRWPRVFVTAGAWANLEACGSGARDAGTLCLGQTVGESNLWAELATWFWRAELTAGVVTYFFDRPDAVPPDVAGFNTREVYLRSQFRFGVLIPRVTASLDVDDVNGRFFDAGATARLPLSPPLVPALYLGAHAGFSDGQAAGPGEPGYFAADGLAFWDCSLALPIVPGGGSLHLTPSIHVQLNRDDATRRVTADVDRSAKWWGGVTLSWHP